MLFLLTNFSAYAMCNIKIRKDVGMENDTKYCPWDTDLRAEQLHIIWDENGNISQDEFGNVLLVPEVKHVKAKKRIKNEK